MNDTPTREMLLRIQGLPDDVVDRYDLSSITALTTGAAPVPQALKEWVIERFGPDVLWEAYGASEAGMISSISPEHQLTKPGSSGRPYDGVDIAIVDEDWNRLPTGSTGEIAVRTPVVLPHYLGRGPIGDDVVRDGFYRTGDVGHMDAEGFFFITDRIKDLIICSGYNVYPRRIEEALYEHPAVEEATVIGIKDEYRGEAPKAFIKLRAGSKATKADILGHLEVKISKLEMPAEIEFRLDAHPDVAEVAVMGSDHPVLGQEVKAVIVPTGAPGADAPFDPEALAAWCGETLAAYKVPTVWERRDEPLPRTASGKIVKGAITGEREVSGHQD